MKYAYFAGGCFWCIASYFYDLNGIVDVKSGYCGGDLENPSYEEVKTQETGHRETIRIEYDDNIISYNELLDIFFDKVNLYDSDGQFIDKGFSYTLAIFYERAKELELAKNKISKIEKESGKHTFISFIEFKKFYLAEEYHQYFSKKNPKEFEEEMIKSGRK